MITKEQSGTKSCCFYASDFHLEMILLPYVKQRINNTKFIILTENNLENTFATLLCRTNLNDEEKENILNIGWKNDYLKKIVKIDEYVKNDEKLTIIINGDEDFNRIIKESININSKVNIIDCFEVGKLNENIKKITENYDSILNIS